MNLPAFITAAVLMAFLAAGTVYIRRTQPTPDKTRLHPKAIFQNLAVRRLQLQLANRDERGESKITTELGMIVLGIVLLVTIFGLLNTFAGDVITKIRTNLGM